MAFAKSMIPNFYGSKSRLPWVPPVVLLLLPRRRVPRFISFTFLVLGLSTVGGLGGFGGVPADAAQRTLVLAPADLVAAPEIFGASALSRSATLGKAIGLKQGSMRFAKGVCPSLLPDPNRRITRVRLLAGAAAAPVVVGKTLGKGLTAALVVMDPASW